MEIYSVTVRFFLQYLCKRAVKITGKPYSKENTVHVLGKPCNLRRIMGHPVLWGFLTNVQSFPLKSMGFPCDAYSPIYGHPLKICSVVTSCMNYYVD